MSFRFYEMTQKNKSQKTKEEDKMHLKQEKQKTKVFSVNKRTTLIILVFAAMFISSSLAVFSYAASEEEANKLYNEAVKLVTAAQKVEPISYQEALSNLNQAIGKLEEISSKYSDSEVAFKVSLGELKIDDYTIPQLKELISKLEKPASLEEEVRKNYYKAAAPILKRALNVRQKSSTQVGRIAKIYAEIEMFEEAQRLRKGFPRYGAYLSSKERKIVYNIESAISQAKALQFVREGHFEEAIQERFSTKTLKAIVETNVKQGKFEEALQVVKRVREVKFIPSEYNIRRKVNTLIEVADLFIKAGEIQKGKQTLDQAIQLISLPEVRKGEISLIIALADKFIEIKQFSKARELFEHVFPVLESDASMRKILRSYKKIAENSSVAGQFGKDLNQLIPKFLEAIEDSKRRNAADFLTIGEVYFSFGNSQKAEQFLLQALQLKKDSIGLLTAIAKVYSEAGKDSKAEHLLAKALQMAEGREDRKESFRSLINVASTYDEMGNRQKAEQILKRLQEEHRYADALVDIAKAYVKMGQKQKAEQVLDEALQITQGVSNRNDITRIFIELGEYEKAETIIEQTVKVAQKIPGERRRVGIGLSFEKRLGALLSTARLWITFAQKCEEEHAVKFLHSMLGKFFESD